jgi:hypothetical protein
MTETAHATWNGEERRLAGNYPGRVAIVHESPTLQTSATLVLQAWPSSATHNKPAVLEHKPPHAAVGHESGLVQLHYTLHHADRHSPQPFALTLPRSATTACGDAFNPRFRRPSALQQTRL